MQVIERSQAGTIAGGNADSLRADPFVQTLMNVIFRQKFCRTRLSSD
jgi:hypothetical protein